jgi:DNA adenine methylase
MTTSSRLSPPLKWHGGKSYLARKIVALMPPRCRTPNKPDPDDPGYVLYVETHFGGGAVLLANDSEGIAEVVNDINGELTNFWRVLQSPTLFAAFERRLQAMPFSQVEWNDAVGEASTDSAERAVMFFVRNRQSLAGRMKEFAPLSKNRTRGGMIEQASAWWSAVDGLPAVHQRLRRVAILNDDATAVIRRHDGQRTLFYCDPPYLHETRASTGEYDHEMTEPQHRELLETLGSIQGRFLLSGYRSDLYDRFATRFGWRRHEFELPNHAAGGESKRRMIECVWCNYEAKTDLFGPEP